MAGTGTVWLGRHDRRDGVLEDELHLMIGFKDNAVLVETLHSTRQLDPTRQVDRDRYPLSAGVVEETVLEVLIRHDAHHPVGTAAGNRPLARRPLRPNWAATKRPVLVVYRSPCRNGKETRCQRPIEMSPPGLQGGRVISRKDAKDRQGA